MDILAKLFGSALRVKIMRLFLFQEGEGYSITEITVRVQGREDSVKKELETLEEIGFIIYKEFGISSFEEVISEDHLPSGKRLRKDARPSKKAPTVIRGFSLNRKFLLIHGLTELLIGSNLISNKEVQRYFSHHPQVKLLILTGIFVKNEDARADLIIVGERIDPKRMNATIKVIESEIGKEIRYSLFTPEEFSYRINMFDKYVLDILNSPHERVIQKMEVPRT